MPRLAGPRVGDYVVLERPASPGNPPSIAEAWDRRRREPSLVVSWFGGPLAEVQLVTRGDRAIDAWQAPSADLRVVGRAAWAMLDENLDVDVAADALRGSTVALDFDGPVHSYRSGWTGYLPTDPPTEGALTFVNFLLDAGARVVIHTSRADSPRGIQGVRHYLKVHGFPPLEVTYEKVPAAAYVDDRAVHFDGRRGYDDTLLAEVIRMCRTRHSGEAHPTERFGEPGDGKRWPTAAELLEQAQLDHLAEGRLVDDKSVRLGLDVGPDDEVIVRSDARLTCVYPGCTDPRHPREHLHDPDHCGERDPHGPHAWMPKPPRVGTSRDCPGTPDPAVFDTESSASVQHFIDTGHYLPRGENDGTA